MQLLRVPRRSAQRRLRIRRLVDAANLLKLQAPQLRPAKLAEPAETRARQDRKRRARTEPAPGLPAFSVISFRCSSRAEYGACLGQCALRGLPDVSGHRLSGGVWVSRFEGVDHSGVTIDQRSRGQEVKEVDALGFV